MEPEYEEQFTAFVDLLGFSEISTRTDDTTRSKVLDILLSLAASRGEFDMRIIGDETNKMTRTRPAVSTFSDHIVISYPLKPMSADGTLDEGIVALRIFNDFTMLVTSIATAALGIGFLIRGGATIGKLYHAKGVVFGEAMVEAYRLESRTAVYPRVVFSPKIMDRPGWVEKALNVAKDNDGLYHVDYFQMMLPEAARSGEGSAKVWYQEAVSVVSHNLTNLKNGGQVTEWAKWVWFARQFWAGLKTLEKRNPAYVELVAGPLGGNPWLAQ